MSSLNLFLPPYASDYTGAASALFEYPCLIAINDGTCCTATYVKYEEPRWEGSKRPTFSTQLRTKDAIFGVDDKVLRQLTEAADTLHPEFMVTLGTPVTALIGTDGVGLGFEITASSAIPTYGINTNGFDLYPSGILAAYNMLIEAFGPKPHPLARQHTAADKPRVIIAGMTTLDYGTQNNAAFQNALQEAGFEICANLFGTGSLDGLRHIDTADCTLAVSSAGLKIAKDLCRRYGMPYVADSCIGQASAERVAGELRAAIAPCEDAAIKGKEAVKSSAETLRNGACGTGSTTPETAPQRKTRTMLYYGDQIIGNALRKALAAHRHREDINMVVATPFGLDAEQALPGDVFLKDEQALLTYIGTHEKDHGSFALVFADPLLKRIPALQKSPFFAMPQPAISGRLCQSEVWNYLSDTFAAALDDVLA